jgi:hypothetical protein
VNAESRECRWGYRLLHVGWLRDCAKFHDIREAVGASFVKFCIGALVSGQVPHSSHQFF